MNFDLIFPDQIAEALDAKQDDARWFAGGTDLLPALKRELRTPARLVNLKQILALRGMRDAGDAWEFGALTTLAELADNAQIRQDYPALAQACELAASPQIRNVATLGGNMNQDTRCAYWRNGFDCYLHGGSTCFMRDGENREGAVIGYADCVHVHPSDPANSLVAFDARLTLRGKAGERAVPAAEFFRAPTARDIRMNVLDGDEMITAIALPKVGANSRSAYVKAMDRAAWAFALASAAAHVQLDADHVQQARVVVGGAAPIPWRETRVEALLNGAAWNEETIAQASAAALAGAQPLAHNHYKLRLARAMVKRALTACLT